jgi:hypothetical protein
MNTILGRLRRHHDSNVSRGLYSYMWWSALKIVLLWFAIMVPVVLLAKYFIDLDPLIHYITNNLSNAFVLLTFLASESLLGMIPPDLFIIWAGKFHSPLFIVTLLGILSYIGGIISYFIGRWISQRPKINAYVEKALDNYPCQEMGRCISYNISSFSLLSIFDGSDCSKHIQISVQILAVFFHLKNSQIYCSGYNLP